MKPNEKMLPALIWDLEKRNKPTGGILIQGSEDGTSVELKRYPGTIPNEAKINAILTAYEAHLNSEKTSRKGRKVALLSKLNMDTNDLQALVELVEDKNAD